MSTAAASGEQNTVYVGGSSLLLVKLFASHVCRRSLADGDGLAFMIHHNADSTDATYTSCHIQVDSDKT